MTTEIPTTEPLKARAGLTWQWRRNDLSPDYPAGTWTLKYWFKKTGSTQANFSITATADGSDFLINHPASTTSGYTAGDYTWAAIVTSGSEAFEVDHGVMELLPRYDQAANLDDRSHARKVLDAIEAVIENRATLDQQEYAIGNRSLKRTPMADLLALRDKYTALVAAENNALAGRGSRIVARL